MTENPTFETRRPQDHISMSVVASSNLGEQINTMHKLEPNQRTESTLKLESSEVFISDAYLSQNQTLTKAKSFFDLENKFENTMLKCLSQKGQTSNLLLSSAEGSIYECSFIKDHRLVQLLLSLQDSLSEYFSSADADHSFNKCYLSSIPGISSDHVSSVLMSDFLALLIELDSKEQYKVVDRANVLYSKKHSEYEMDLTMAISLVSLIA